MRPHQVRALLGSIGAAALYVGALNLVDRWTLTAKLREAEASTSADRLSDIIASGVFAQPPLRPPPSEPRCPGMCIVDDVVHTCELPTWHFMSHGVTVNGYRFEWPKNQ